MPKKGTPQRRTQRNPTASNDPDTGKVKVIDMRGDEAIQVVSLRDEGNPR
jgi:hypothetical protein